MDEISFSLISDGDSSLKFLSRFNVSKPFEVFFSTCSFFIIKSWITAFSYNHWKPGIFKIKMYHCKTFFFFFPGKFDSKGRKGWSLMLRQHENGVTAFLLSTGTHNSINKWNSPNLDYVLWTSLFPLWKVTFLPDFWDLSVPNFFNEQFSTFLGW